MALLLRLTISTLCATGAYALLSCGGVPSAFSLQRNPTSRAVLCQRHPRIVYPLSRSRTAPLVLLLDREPRDDDKDVGSPKLLLSDFARIFSQAPATPATPQPDALTVWKSRAQQAAAPLLAAAANVKPLQILLGFGTALALVASSVAVTSSAISDFLAENQRGLVLERAILFGAILEDVNDAYVEQEVDIDRLFQTGVNAMLSSLDPYSTYENARQAEDLFLRTSGRYGGVGLTIGRDGDDVLVLGALEGFAFDAGVRAGDRILKIDNQPVRGLDLDRVKAMLRGEPGTNVQLLVQRDGATESDLALDLGRKLVRLPDIPLATEMRPGVGYIKLDGFTEGTADEMAAAIRNLALPDPDAAEAKPPLQALVLDLRDNPGGLLDAAVAVSQQLVPEGTHIVSTAGRVYGGEGSSLSYSSAKPPLLPPDTRLVVLVNRNTASAAEIVTGVVQDTDRGVVVGQRTFGKGLVQIVEPLPGGASLKLTVAKYYTPSGRCIQAMSYTPRGEERAVQIDGEDEDEDEMSSAYSNSIGKRVKDALRESFRTSNGRPVRSAGGIDPDIAVEPKAIGELERSLLQRGLFFKYAGEWLQQHAGAPQSQIRALDAAQESTYRDFVRYARAADAKAGTLAPHSRVLSEKLTALEKAIAASGDRQKSAREVQVLRQLLVEEDLAQFSSQKEAISADLREAVLARLTKPSARAASILSADPQVIAAVDLALDANKYSSLLAPPPSPSPLTTTAAAEPAAATAQLSSAQTVRTPQGRGVASSGARPSRQTMSTSSRDVSADQLKRKHFAAIAEELLAPSPEASVYG